MIRLPLMIGGEILIRKVDQQALKGKFTILGARTGNFIIIDDPVVRFSDRLFARISGDIICRYLTDGDIYDFHSKVRTHLEEGIALIDYPTQVKESSLRMHPRIRINLETKVIAAKNREVEMHGVMTDISEGGCRLKLQSLHEIALESTVLLTFSLPDKSQVQSLNAIVRASQIQRLKKSTDVGLQFVGPPEELAKVTSFCQFCMFFEV